jgi:hypothetical protein
MPVTRRDTRLETEARRMLECFITAELSRSSAPRAALQLQVPFSSGGFRETWSHCTHAHAWKCQAHARVAKYVAKGRSHRGACLIWGKRIQTPSGTRTKRCAEATPNYMPAVARAARPGCSCACALCLLRCWLCYGLHWLSSAFLKLEILDQPCRPLTCPLSATNRHCWRSSEPVLMQRRRRSFPRCCCAVLCCAVLCCCAFQHPLPSSCCTTRHWD